MSLTHEIAFTLNGVTRHARVGAEISTLALLRDVIGLTGTKYGCGEGECGACTILVDGDSVNACLMFALDCDGRTLTTIEGLSTHPTAQAVQRALVAHGAVQCGFCTPGMVVQGMHTLQTCGVLDAPAAQRAIEGNLCRCTGYQKIVDALVDASASIAPAKEAS